MHRQIRRALTAALLVTASGVVGLLPGGAATPSAVRLHLASDGQRFSFGTTTQSLTTESGTCRINSPEPLIDLSAAAPSTSRSSSSSTQSPGLVNQAIGVRGSSTSNGTPCGQTDAYETLTMRPGTALGTRKFIGVRLDLELCCDAVVKLTLSSSTTTATYQLQTGTSIQTAQRNEPDYDSTVPYVVSSAPGDTTDACAAPNSSGPNNGPNDNCQWTVMPGFGFDKITLTTTKGSVSLEGSNDFAGDPAYDTLFYLTNSAPTANPDTVSTLEDTAVSGNVLGNDSDPEGTPLTASLVSGPSHGSLGLASSGAFTYTPNANYYGPDSFTYRASDGIDTATAVASITVQPVNDAPEAVSGSTTVNEDESVTIPVATDVDDSSLTSECTVDGEGSYVDEGDGSITFTPDPDVNGPATITCTVTDPHGASTTPSALVSVGITSVNDAPVGVPDTFEVPQDVATALDVVGNDQDVEGDPLTPIEISGITPAGATAEVQLDGSVLFTPPLDYTGPAGFDYVVSDGTADAAEPTAVAITVYPTLCSLETVTDTDLDTTGSFTRLSDPFECKRYDLETSQADDSVLFVISGDALVSYRGEIAFSPEPAPTPGGPGTVTLLLRYDPLGGDDFRPVQWCVDPQFDGFDQVVSAIIPAGETWCVASADTRPDVDGDLVTTWEVYGRDDPKFTR